MNCAFNIMTQEQAETIAFTWHYEGDYSFYDMEEDQEDLAEFLHPEARGDTIYAVTSEGELIAFLSVTMVSSNTFDIGLGMKPNLTGRGKGEQFLRAAIDFMRSKYRVEKITLSVTTFNQRAIKVYRKIGFKDAGLMMQDTNGGTYEFLHMEYLI